MTRRILPLLAILPATALFAEEPPERPLGYSDTPMLPHADWKVHDIDRPHPTPVQPGATPADPPADAIILFDGADLSGWYGEREEPNEDPEKKPKRIADPDVPAAWKVIDGHVEVTPTGNIYSREEFADIQLHIEWRSPSPAQDNSQNRGNSGIFLMDRYEIQVLDGHDNPTYADGHPGALYGQYPPLVNAARQPGEWQVYDIIFKAPTVEDGKVVAPAYVTVIHNGIVVQNHVELLGKTRHKAVATYEENHPEAGPIRLQDHNDNQAPAFRNIWVRKL